jgi:benzylsuccinate CoA-transferase BbsF subunit
VGPYGTITDSLAPRFVSAALAAGLLYHRRTGNGVYLDISQVESANWSLSPWLLDYEVDGVLRLRDGNRHAHMAPHGAFRCADESGVSDRWVAIACRTDHDWGVLASIIGADASKYPTLADRKRREDEVEALVTAYTKTRTRAEVAQLLQANGIEAVPVEDFADLHDDPQLALRKHFLPHTHAFLGPGLYERNGFRMADAPGGYDQAGPTLGQDSDWVLRDLLGCTDAEIEQLKASGAVE